MDYSLNEIESTMRKAIIGAGYSTGVAQDISRASAWLCTKGMDGAGILFDVLGKTVSKPNVSVTNEGLYEFKDLCVLSCGTSVIDVLVSELKGSTNENSESQVQLSNIDAPFLLVGLAASVVKEFRVTIEVFFSNGENFMLSPAIINFSDIEIHSGIDAVLKCSEVKTARQNGGYVEIESESDSISIPEITLLLLNEFAEKTYVPATEASRLAGAGAGLTDND